MTGAHTSAQELYTTPITQHWPTIFTTEFDDINRSIFIDSESITLITQTAEGKLIESYGIIEVKEGIDSLRYLCATRTGEQLVTFIIPFQEKVEIIDIYRPSSVTGEVEQLRLWVN